ncbi:hypothetical protein SMF913_27081 [Streptomyces malaysiensis]|uniref:Uncharacterized protein n=1 Tax=Streptomyces malaysiensis TaxID=92644 RepID=A0A2J7YUA2_STRMQ|nr:hypothetical protein SMF913_27081 [Streptomyces malaysiensis]
MEGSGMVDRCGGGTSQQQLGEAEAQRGRAFQR